MLYLTREEFRTAATTLGFKPATLRQWRRRRAIPAAAKFRLVYFFNDNFEILEAPPSMPANSTLASLAARYIRWSPNMTNQHSSRELPSQAAIAEKLDVSISSIKRARTIKATGAITAPAAAFAMLHRIYARAQDMEDFWPPFGPENDQAIQDFLVQLEKTLDAAKRIRTS